MHSLVFAQYRAGLRADLCQEGQAALALAEAVIALAAAQDFAFFEAAGHVLKGRALAQQGDKEAGMACLQQGFDALLHAGQQPSPQWLAWQGEFAGEAGRIVEGQQHFTEAIALAESTGERYYLAECYRLQGEQLTSTGDEEPQAESYLRQALDIARQQQAKCLELRAAASLARLWRQQGKCDSARKLLAPIYYGFDESHDAVDLRQARALLDML